MKNIISLLILSPLIIFSCKKYPEGPSFSLRSPSQRIIGAWNLKSYLINGNDSMSMFSYYSIVPGFDIKDPGVKDSSGYLIRGGIDTTNYVSSIGLYELNNKKTELVVTPAKIVNVLNLSGPLMSASVVTYKILRLKKNELWLQTNYNGTNYEFHYER